VISLFSVGPFLERVLGHSRFAVVYLVGGMAGSVVTLVTNTGPTTGAGPASIAMLGALVVVYLRARTGVGSILQLVLINLVINVLLVGSGGGLYWIGVLGGLVIGALLTFIYSLKPVREHPNRRNSLVVLVVIALLVIAAVRMLLG
jgi:membrane associated rhomboid family serine protease